MSSAASPSPRPYFEDDAVKLYLGDALEILPLLSPVDVVVTDPGSGSTGLAARQLGREALLIEKDERYAEAAARRLSQMELVA